MLTRRVFALLLVLIAASSVGIAALRRLGVVLPGGEIIYTVSDRQREGASPDLWRLDLAHALTLNFTRHPASDFAPVWSPDGRRLLFLSDRDGGSRLYIISAEGGRAVALTPQAGSYGGFRVSSDGERIVFIGIQGAAQILYSVRADGSDLEMLTDQTREVSGMLMEIGMDAARLSAAFSFTPLSLRFDGNSWGLYIAQPGAETPSDWRRLASTGHLYTESPTWSPDGVQIAYISDADGRFDVYTVEVATGAVRRWTTNDAVESAPQWRPG